MRMLYYYIHTMFLVFCMLLAGSSFAQVPEMLFQKGNEYYEQADYAQAIETYEKIIDQGYESPGIYYNLGNAYFKSDSLAKAILYYERAQKLAPNDEDIQFNLRIANLKVVDKVETLPDLFFVEWWKSLVNAYSSSGWATIFLVLLFAGAFLMIGYLFASNLQLKKTLFFTGVVVFGFAILTLFPAISRHHFENNSRYGIITAENTYVKSAPNQKALDAFILHEGSKVELLDNLDEWVKVKFDEDKIGWMKKTDLEKI